MISLMVDTDPKLVASIVFASIIDNTHERYEEEKPKMSAEMAITQFCPLNSIETLFHSSTKYPDNYVLKIEQNIAIDIYISFILANDLELRKGDIEVSYTKDFTPFLLLELWSDIVFSLNFHKTKFCNTYPNLNYYYTNLYIYDIVKTVNNLANAVANKINSILKSNFTADDLMTNNIFKVPEINDIISLIEDITPLKTLLKDLQ